MSNANKVKQTEILAIRMSQPLINQLNALALAKGMGTATMARMALIDYLKAEAPNALIGVATPAPVSKLTGKPINPARAMYEAMSPAERKEYDDTWDY